MKRIALASLAVILTAASAAADDAAVSRSTLSDMGLRAMQPMTDHDGLAIRGKALDLSGWPFAGTGMGSIFGGLFGNGGNNGGNNGNNNGNTPGGSGGGGTGGLGSGWQFPGGGPSHGAPSATFQNPFGYGLGFPRN